MSTDDPWIGLPPQTGSASDFLTDGGRLGEAIRGLDWSATSIGSLDSWPVSLKAVVRMMLASKQAICLFVGRDLHLLYNEAYAHFLGKKEAGALGQPFRDIWSDVWVAVLPLVQETLAGRSVSVKNMPLMMNRNGYDEKTWWSFTYSPLFDDVGHIVGLINIASETTQLFEEQRDRDQRFSAAQRQIEVQGQSERQQRVLQREMVHRIKNTLAMATAIVSQTMRTAVSMEVARDTISSRIAALASAQDVLLQSRSGTADLRRVIEQALAPHKDREERMTLVGLKAEISAQQALGLSLAIHELATNAAKYGALSNAAGCVQIEWVVARGDALRLVWQEIGGPAVAHPRRMGFGSRLTGRIVASYFDGKGETVYDPAGIRFVLEGTLDRNPVASVEPVPESGT